MILAKVLAAAVPTFPSPEQMKRGQAKQALFDLLAALPADRRAAARREVARLCDPDVIAKRCPAFQAFLDGLRAALSRF